MIIEQAIEVLKAEAKGVLDLIDKLDRNFVEAVELICASKGRVIVSGIGKSGLIGKKITATLNSTGTSSLYIHPVEAMHGDLGMVTEDDVFLAISNSGETYELNVLLPIIRKIGCSIISFTGNTNSYLAKQSDFVINTKVEKEACPMGLAPTTSTTAQLAIGDALAVALIHKKKFKKNDFKKNHPSGSLGIRLSKKAADFMLHGDLVPNVAETCSMREVLIEMDRVGLGAAFIVRTDQTLVGIITDGDIRRCLAKNIPIYEKKVRDIMTKDPLSASADTPAYDALNFMEENEITVLPITDEKGKVKGILHLHDILGKGEFKFTGN